MNQQQIAAWLRVTLAAGGPIAALIIAKTGITQADYVSYLELALALVPGAIAAGWSWYRNRSDVQIKTTNMLPEVAKVVVKDSANGKVGDMAQSEDHPKVVTETQNALDVKGGT